MANLAALHARVQEGETVTFRPHGHSMKGLVPSGALVDVAPVVAENVATGDVVLVKVAGRVYLHKVLTNDHTRQRVQIGNNRGGVNGWAPYTAVAGIATTVNGTTRPRLAGKVRT